MPEAVAVPVCLALWLGTGHPDKGGHALGLAICNEYAGGGRRCHDTPHTHTIHGFHAASNAPKNNRCTKKCV